MFFDVGAEVGARSFFLARKRELGYNWLKQENSWLARS